MRGLNAPLRVLMICVASSQPALPDPHENSLQDFRNLRIVSEDDSDSDDEFVTEEVLKQERAWVLASVSCTALFVAADDQRTGPCDQDSTFHYKKKRTLRELVAAACASQRREWGDRIGPDGKEK